LFATPAQRLEYVSAIEKTRHFLSISTQGNASHDELLQVIKYTGVFESLVHLLMDRVARAASECNRVWEEKSGLAAEAAEDRAARRARERAARGTCIICLDEKPNIATLCCGKATHLNCIAEWLSGQTTCPMCRSEMPAISGRVVRAARAVGDDETTEGDEVGQALAEARQNIRDIRETRELLFRIYDQVASRNRERVENDNGSYTMSSSSSDEDSSNGGFFELSPGGGESDAENDDGSRSRHAPRDRRNRRGPQGRRVRFELSSASEEEDDYDEDAVDFFLRSQYQDTTTTSTMDIEAGHDQDQDTTTTTATSDSGDESNSRETENESSETNASDNEYNHSEPLQEEAPPRICCLATHCRNRPAVDCANQLCGRCCVLFGEYSCLRHNSRRDM
jgi:hypothetical protein